MPAYRSTISTVWTSFYAHMGRTAGFSKVAEGEATPGVHPRPYLLVQLLGAVVSSRADRDKLWTASVKLRIVATIPGGETATTEILELMAAAENMMDGYERPTGVEGFENAQWSLTFPTDPSGGNTVMADGLVNFTVTVTRGSN